MQVNLICKARPNLMVEETDINFYKEVANAIYVNARTASEAKFALRIVEAVGEIEINDEEKGYIKKVAETFVYWAKAAILKAIGEKAE